MNVLTDSVVILHCHRIALPSNHSALLELHMISPSNNPSYYFKGPLSHVILAMSTASAMPYIACELSIMDNRCSVVKTSF